MQEWLETTNNTVVLWSDLDSERVSIENNLKKLKVILLFVIHLELIPQIIRSVLLRAGLGTEFTQREVQS